MELDFWDLIKVIEKRIIMDIYEKISEKLFEYFVANDNIIAVQMPDGNYIPQKIKYNKFLFEKMLEKRSSLAVYQQKSYSYKIKWLCFDFDIKNNDKSIEQLYQKYIKKLIELLEKDTVNFLVEFSGRRGIHVWIIFEQFINKDEGFNFLKYYVNKLDLDEAFNRNFGLDLFPAVSYGSTKMGKAVKLPLSVHKKGGQSYFIEKYKDKLNIEIMNLDLKFLENQYNILDNYKKNDKKILKSFGSKKNYPILKKQILEKVDDEFSLFEIERNIQSSFVLRQLFLRINEGLMTNLDRKIIVGVFGKWNTNILNEIFQKQHNYNYLKTREMIEKYKSHLYPITMNHLYDLYHYQLEETIDGTKSILEFIAENMNISSEKIKEVSESENSYQINKAKVIANKELKYLNDNDEIASLIDITYFSNLYDIDFKNINEKIDKVISGEKKINNIKDYKTYKRYEKNKNDARILVSLDPEDRIITSYLTYELSSRIKWEYNSYSYNLNYLIDENMFYPWFSSWKRFINDIELYMKFEIFEDYGLLKIDITKFYDNISLHAIYSSMIISAKSKKEKIELENILDYLIKYNDILMRKITGKRTGVPQGPVYARVLSEFFMSLLISKFFDKYPCYDNDIQLFRYVDDIYIIYKKIDGNEFIKKFSTFIMSFGLEINFSKTYDYGLIKNMTNEDKYSLFNSSHWNYEVMSIREFDMENEDNIEENIRLFNNFINRNKEWDISDANFVLNDYVIPFYKDRYIDEYYKKIIMSKEGRGSIFTKFYEIIFNNNDKSFSFFKNKDYLLIPRDSLNDKICNNKIYKHLNFLKLCIEPELIIDYVIYKKEHNEYDDESTLILNLIEKELKENG